MTEHIYCFTESQLATLLESARNGDSIPHIMLAIEDGEIEQTRPDHEHEHEGCPSAGHHPKCEDYIPSTVELFGLNDD